MREPVTELTDCRNCASQFDLAAQYYYDNLCPSCKREQDGEDAVNPVIGACYVCDTDVRKTEQCWSSKPAPYDVRGDVLTCPEHVDHRYSPGRGV